MIRRVFTVLVVALIGACDGVEDAGVRPSPVTLTVEAAGHYCQMTVLDHPGPKAQAHLAGLEAPLWFAQVRDAIAFERMPEQTAEVTVIYVSDMGVAADWDHPGIDNWISLREAVFVHGSSRRSGMGAPEIVPFSTEGTAQHFASEYGGTVVTFDEISDEMVLGPVDVDLESVPGVGHAAGIGGEG